MKYQIIKYKNYICETEEENTESNNEVIIAIYENEKQFENGEYIERVSLLKEDLENNIKDYIEKFL